MSQENVEIVQASWEAWSTGHFVAEEAPDEMLAALTAFLAPYRDGSVAAHDAGPHAAIASAP